MTTAALTAKRQAELVAARVRGRHVRTLSEPLAGSHRPLADVLPLLVPAPQLAHRPVTRAIGPTGRVRLSLRGRRTLDSLLGWAPGPLVVSLEGAWAVLTPAPSPCLALRDGATCTYLDDGRLRVSSALCAHLGLRFGDEAAFLVCPEAKAVALCDPARLLLGAPLSLAASAGCATEANQ